MWLSTIFPQDITEQVRESLANERICGKIDYVMNTKYNDPHKSKSWRR